MISNKNKLLTLFQDLPESIDLTNKKRVYILGQNSSIYLSKCNCNTTETLEAISFGFNFNKVYVDQTQVSNINYQNIIISNSIAYISESCKIQRKDKSNPIVNNIQIGSLNDFTINQQEITIKKLFNKDIDTLQQSIYINPTFNYKNKQQFNNSKDYNKSQKIETLSHSDNLGDGINYVNESSVLKMTSHFLSNKRFGYWSSIYKGQLTGDNKYLCNNKQELNLLLTRIPRNLNGYTFEIDANNFVLSENIKNFYNGILILKNCNIQNGIEIIDNDCSLYLYLYSGYNIKAQNNKQIIITFNYNIQTTQSLLKEAINNIIEVFNNGSYYKLLDTSSYGNTITFSAISETTKAYCKNDVNGNMYYVKGLITTAYSNYTGLLNHSHEGLYTELHNLFQKEKEVNEVKMLKKRFASDIGSIVGWPVGLSIPIGYYACDGSTHYIDSQNPNDLYYNVQLAYILNQKNNIDNGFFVVPNIPQMIGKDESNKMQFIIKYNNNFQHLRNY